MPACCAAGLETQFAPCDEEWTKTGGGNQSMPNVSSLDWAADIDWAAPWLEPSLRAAGRAVLHAALTQTLHAALNAHMAQCSGAAAQRLERAQRIQAWLPQPCFVPQSDLPAQRAYETHIRATGHIPTRLGLHDFFNALIWLNFPALKMHLNALQDAAIAAQVAAARAPSQRGVVRDAITLLDENGAFLIAPRALCQALAQRRWMDLFVRQRALWRHARLVIVGHALLEQLVRPRKNLCAHVLVVENENGLQNPHQICCNDLDALFCSDQRLSADFLSLAPQKPFLPLPILGVPGWWPENECADFYADAAVFRPLPQQ